MAVSGKYLAWRARSSAQPFVRAYGQWVNEHIIPIVNDFEKQAQAMEEETYERLSSQINPETYAGDGSEFHERAFNASLSFYQTIVSLYQATINLFAAGLFHLVEQQLAHLAYDAAMKAPVPNTQLLTVTEYYRDDLKIDFSQFGGWDVIQELRLVANTTKHGEGPSAEQLRNIRPGLFQHPTLRKDKQTFLVQFRLQLPLAGDGLYVTADDFKRYENAANGIFDFVIEQFNNNHHCHFPCGESPMPL